MISKSDCEGCRNNFYNGNNALGVNECWSFKEARIDTQGKYEIHRDAMPPYRNLKMVERPKCWHGERIVRVLPTAITQEGYWR